MGSVTSNAMAGVNGLAADKRSMRQLVARAAARLFALWCVLLPALALAQQDRASDPAFWEEPCHAQAKATRFEDLRQEDFTRYEGVLAQGYGACAIWVRLRLAPAPGSTVLRILPTYLDEIALHDPLLAQVLVRGDRHPPEAGTRDRAIRFTVPGGQAPRHVWLRLSTSSTRLLSVQALSPEDAQAKERRADWVQGAFLLLLGAPLPWAVLQWFHLRDRVMAVFAVKQASTFSWAFLLLGYGPAVLGAALSAPAIDRLTSVLVVGVVTASIWFELTLLAGYQVPRWGMHVLRGLAALLPLLMMMQFFGHASAALQANMIVAWLLILLSCVLFLLARRHPPDNPLAVSLPPQVLAVYSALNLAALSSAAALQLGLVQGNQLTMYALFGHGLLSSVVMMVLLNVRAGMQARAVGALAAAQARAEQERLHREEQERLVGMLVHEMRAPLATVRMLLGEGPPSPQQFNSMQRSLADMNGLLERCAQASQLDGEGLQPQWTECDLWQTLLELASARLDTQRLALSYADRSAPGSATVRADPQWLRIILGNLIDNACKYSPADSTVQVSLTPQDDSQDPAHPRAGFAVDVANLPGAAGWPDAAQLFTKYYRHPFARRSTGSGLGLYLVAGLVQRLQGHIRYQPTPEQIRFRLWLPA